MPIVAPAKINLNLRVLGRNEATGYHDLETWMVPVSLADELRVVLTTDPAITLTCSDPELDGASGNLAWKAAELFCGKPKAVVVRVSNCINTSPTVRPWRGQQRRRRRAQGAQ
jgi:4-diphosphocytidyl-2C-methyl-D-erythritol 2-phosphate synthase